MNTSYAKIQPSPSKTTGASRLQALYLRCWVGFKQETVLITAFLCSLLTMIWVPPASSYIGYIDFRVLILLFCLMVTVAGFQQCGLFETMAEKLLARARNLRTLFLVLVLLPFFGSMLITNDVALIAFVPFAIVVLGIVNQMHRLAYVIVLQTLAANLGSMTTPVGNPQNLFLYSKFHIPVSGFFALMLPYAAMSLIALAAAVFLVRKESITVQFPERNALRNTPMLVLLSILFLLCLLSVFHLVPAIVVLAAVVLSLLIFDRGLLRRADYGLLLTFVFFFICAGNIGQIDSLRQFLSGIMHQNATEASILTSQVISNVPAAVLLSGFTDNWRTLLVGTNLGGMGTLVASLASLISFKLYVKSAGARPWRYLLLFSAANAVGLALLVSAAMALGQLS